MVSSDCESPSWTICKDISRTATDVNPIKYIHCAVGMFNINGHLPGGGACDNAMVQVEKADAEDSDKFSA